MLISLITYRDLPELDPDDQLLAKALQQRGCKVQGLVWNDEKVDWSKAGVCIIRSTWDYHLHYEKFCQWLVQTSKVTSVWNAAELILWNSKKTYLRDLARAGLPIIPSVFVDANSTQSLAEIMLAQSWTDVVIKPTVGLATAGVLRVSGAHALDAGDEHIHELLKTGEAMVQEFMSSVEGYGERALSFIDGKYSHCVRKAPFQALAVAGRAGETAVEATAAEIEIAERTLAFLDVIPLYARVDLVGDKDNNPQLMEFELVEPSLFLQTKPEAAELFADAVVSRVACLKS